MKEASFFRTPGKHGQPREWRATAPKTFAPTKATRADVEAAKAAQTHPGEHVVDVAAGDNVGFPTWAWPGTTNVILQNVSAVVVFAQLEVAGQVQSWELGPAGQGNDVKHVSGQWGGWYVWITNATDDSRAVLQVSVW